MTEILNDLNAVLYRSYNTCSSLKKSNTKNKLKRNGIFNSFLELLTFVVDHNKYKSDIVFFTYGVNRVEKNGFRLNKFSDSISSLSPNYKCINFEDGIVSKAKNKDCNVINFNISFLDFISKVFSRLLGVNLGKRDSNVKGYEDYLSKFGRKNKVQYLLYYFFFKAILKVTQPKIIFVTNWYSIRSMAIISVAHKLGITVVDVQHGLSAANNHRCYINLSNLNENILPSNFFCWSKKDKDIIDSQFLFDRAIAVGRVWRFLPKEVIELPFKNSKPIVIVICGLDLPSWFPQLDEEIKNKFNYLIRPHPTFGLSQKSKASISKFNSTYINDSGSLEDILDYADCCIGEWSAGLVEAQENGTVTIAYGTEACNYFQDSKVLSTDNFDSFVHYLDNYVKYAEQKELITTKYEDNIIGFINDKVNKKQ